MKTGDEVVLQRSCAAVLIPDGTPITLAAGTPVRLAQSLGETFTVVAEGRLVRIDGREADALGLAPAQPAQSAPPNPSPPLDEQLVWDRMRTVFDPEIPVNIVDLGLIYDCCVTPLAEGSHRVEVKMTLTAPGCGMSEVLRADVETRIREIPGVEEVEVEVVWDPPWHQSMMTEAARLELGLL